LVLKGYVNNVINTEGSGGDEYCMSSLAYRGKPGHYDKVVVKTAMSFLTHTKVYGEGDWYSMTKDQIHSINFSKDAVVLFFEGETQTSMTFVLEPWVNGQCIPMMKTQDWMFQK
jgi:hypothetical protein